MVSTINGSLAPLEESPKPASSSDAKKDPSPEEAARAAAAYAALDKSLDALQLKDIQLKALMAAYQTNVKQATKALKQLEKASKAGDKKQVRRATRSLRQVKATSRATTGQITRHCHPTY